MSQRFNLRRFVEAQEAILPAVMRELHHGAKQSHWMWFVFPQIRGLGRSSVARRYEIGSLAEAQAYSQHPVLGPRLRACTEAVLRHRDSRIRTIFPNPDDLKFHSCMTLFSRVVRDEALFPEALERFFEGEVDASTVWRIREAEAAR